jgi:hypothetical protein
MRTTKLAIAVLAVAFMFQLTAVSQAVPIFPPEVMDRKASIVGVRSTPPGVTVKVDGTVVPPNAFMLLKKDKPRVLRFELAGYKTIEKEITPGVHYIIGIGVDFAHHQVDVAEFDQPPGVAAAQPAPVAAPAPAEAPAPPAQPAAMAAPEQPQAPQTARPTTRPFGFDFGMTKEQAIARLGKTAVVKDTGVTVVFNTAPNGHPDFESYILSFSPKAGLLKIRGVSKTFETSDDGSELRSKFHTFHDALGEKYGKAEKDFDFCKASDVACRSEYFMMTLMEKNRYLNSYWTAGKSNLPLHVQNIAIEAIALGINKGYIEIGYEFDGWDQFVDEINSKRNSSF